MQAAQIDAPEICLLKCAKDRKGRETAIVRRIWNGFTKPYSPNPDLDYACLKIVEKLTQGYN